MTASRHAARARDSYAHNHTVDFIDEVVAYRAATAAVAAKHFGIGTELARQWRLGNYPVYYIEAKARKREAIAEAQRAKLACGRFMNPNDRRAGR